ncbi:DUF6049 family protein [Kitasatospora paracochleata]|uniref:Secreted protein n=1 Tax=Kitasatospora paracochleata TaxID=58354 RepID=A0ABT1J7H2_9ACTN|nr:DUF6049 family protein [Kitasatospora paracochleata]MCP2313159.1 hypothetical protein [Kitasatospora paracochleata]
MDERTGRSVGGRALRGRRTGRLARAAASALVAGGLLATSAATTASAVGSVLTASPEYPATIEIDTVTPQSAADNGTVVVTGKVTNSGKSTLKSPTVAVRGPVQGRPLKTRSDLNLIATRTTPMGQDGVALDHAQQDVGDLAPGRSASFSIPVAVADLGLKHAGVYELAVDVHSGTGEKAQQLGITRTFLPYQSGFTAKPTQVSVVWPITHAPELVAQTMPDNDQMPVLRDDSLVGELAPGGRLDQLVTLGADLPNLTWVVDPDLLDTVYAMTKPYRVQKPDTGGESAREDNTVPGTGKDAATAWLTKLRTAVARTGDEVVSLPYADPDLASIAHNGAGLNGMETALRKAATAGQVTAEGRLSVEVKANVAWPYQGWLDKATAGVAATTGGKVVLVNGASMPESKDLPYTPNAARPIGNGQTAVVADPTVSGLFQGDLAGDSARTATVQRFLAETMMISDQEPEQPRGLLVLPPRSLTAGTATALHDAVLKSQAGGWVSPASLDSVAGTAADPEANTSVPDGYSHELAGSELSAGELADTMGVQDGVDQLMVILTQPQRVRGPFSAAMVRSMSTEWRDQPKAGADYRVSVREYLHGLRTAVKVPLKTAVTLPGDNATLLVSVKNDLTQSVGNLELRLTSSQVNRLNVGDKQPVVLDAMTSKTYRFPAEAQVNGPVQVTAQLWTTGPHAQKYGDPVVFTVEVTSVASGVWYVIGGGLVLMVLAGLRFSLQRRKRAAAGEADEDPERLLDNPPTAPQGGAGEEPGKGPQSAAQAAPDTLAEDGPGDAPQADPQTADDRDRVAGDEKVGH